MKVINLDSSIMRSLFINLLLALGIKCCFSNPLPNAAEAMDELSFTMDELKSSPNDFFSFSDHLSGHIHEDVDMPDFEIDVTMTDDEPIPEPTVSAPHANPVIRISEQQVAEYLTTLKAETTEELKTQFSMEWATLRHHDSIELARLSNENSSIKALNRKLREKLRLTDKANRKLESSLRTASNTSTLTTAASTISIVNTVSIAQHPLSPTSSQPLPRSSPLLLKKMPHPKYHN